ncbi:MAG: hypothetical protein PHQ05_08295 [Sterolibacterium sp.]|nr:hypothetical protein [Sterolibacterium sp.]
MRAIDKFLGLLLTAVLPMLCEPSWALSMDVAMVTSVQGTAMLANEKEVSKPLVAFSKLHQGERLALNQNAKVQVVYFENGRQETWSGKGVVEIGTQESNSALKPEVKVLPPLLAKQLVKTPAANVQGRAGMIVMRSIATSEKIKSIDENYASLKKQVEPGEISPELYLLSALFEIKEFERIRSLLSDLGKTYPERADVKDLVSHYQRMVELATSK